MASADVPAAITIGRFDLAEVGERAPDGSIWIEGVRSGTHHAVRSDRVATVTPDDIESMHRGFVTVLAEGWFGAGQGAPIRNDPTHAAFKGSADSALHARIGSIHETQVRLNDDASKSLLMRVTWTDQGRALVDSKQFSSGSIEALPPGTPSKITGEPLADWSLVGFVITNTPMVGGLAPLAAADLPPSTQLEQDMTDKIINQALGLADTASDSERFEAIRLLTDKANKAEALELGLSEVTASRDDLKTERDELADWRWDRVLSDAVSAGRIAPTQKDSYRQIVATLGVEKAEGMFPARKLPVQAKGSEGGQRVEGSDPNVHDAFQATMADAIKGGSSYEDAFTLAENTHAQALADEYRFSKEG